MVAQSMLLAATLLLDQLVDVLVKLFDVLFLCLELFLQS